MIFELNSCCSCQKGRFQWLNLELYFSPGPGFRPRYGNGWPLVTSPHISANSELSLSFTSKFIKYVICNYE